MFRWHLLKISLAVALLCGLLLSQRLWLTARTYPPVPVWDALPPIPSPLDWLVLGSLVVALGVIVVLPRPRLVLCIFVGVAGLYSLWDQTRWQPWFYQYLGMIAVLGFGPAPTDEERAQASLNACRLIVAALYCWSGLQKVNVNFAEKDYLWLLEPLLQQLPASWHGLVTSGGWVTAFAECGIGLGLLVWPLRPVAVVGALAMHAFILFSLGPWGHNWNTIVWPWNLAMMIFVVLLFAKTRPVQPWHILWPRRCLVARVTLVLFGILPLFNFFECWDSYLSAALYSGNTPDARFFISQEVYDRLPTEALRHTQRRNVEPDDTELDCPYEVDMVTWSMKELNVPPYPAPRVFRGQARRLAALPGNNNGGGQVILMLTGRTDWRTGQGKETWETFDASYPP